jgi:hypothetical protein
MAFTARKTILDGLEYRLGMIRINNGYQTDMVTAVRQRDLDNEPFAPEECPAINIKDGDAKITHNISNDEHDFPVSLEIHTTSRVTTDEVESMIADVARCLDMNDTWAGAADGTAINSHGVSIVQDGDTITAATIDITINYTTDKGKI